MQRMKKQEQHRWDHQPEVGFWSRSPFQISITSSVYEIGRPTTKLFFCLLPLVDLATLDSYEEGDDDNENEGIQKEAARKLSLKV